MRALDKALAKFAELRRAVAFGRCYRCLSATVIEFGPATGEPFVRCPAYGFHAPVPLSQDCPFERGRR